MTIRVRRAALALAAGIGLWLGSAQAAAPSSPSGQSVLRLMVQETARVRTLHGSGAVHGPAGVLTLSGDCQGIVRRSHKVTYLAGVRVMSWVHGFLRHAGKTSDVNVHLISVELGTGTIQAWSRSPSSQNQWRVAGRGAAVAEIYTGQLCYPLYARANLSGGKATWTNLGAQTIDGHDAWHIRSQSRTTNVAAEVTNLYVDRSTHDLLRYDTIDTPIRIHGATRTTVDYSAFNRKLNIVAPKIGATRP